MKNIKILTIGDYTLIRRVLNDGRLYEFVVAWLYDEQTDTWQQGHYFSNSIPALIWLRDRYKNEYSKVEELDKLIDACITAFGNQ